MPRRGYKAVTVPEWLWKVLRERSSRMGLSIPDYLAFLVDPTRTVRVGERGSIVLRRASRWCGGRDSNPGRPTPAEPQSQVR